MNDIEVLQVLRKGDEALHFTQKPVEVGTDVVQKINWVRRFDHMQQHSGIFLLNIVFQLLTKNNSKVSTIHFSI